MADDGFDDDEGCGGGGAVEDTGLDKDGFHVVSNAGKFAEKANPLQQRIAEEKRRCVCARAAVDAQRTWQARDEQLIDEGLARASRLPICLLLRSIAVSLLN